ncbi:MAG: helix-turn-helix transcriptional regulator [Bacteriovoracaceae bacterium]|nr:helix-turn-helix transcriptional regulator [Bacteriovoracaceae bacterium]
MKKIERIPLDRILKALGDPIRLSVIKQLLNAEDHEMTCGSFEYCVQKATFSHHIKILIDSQILCQRVEGVRKYLSINNQIENTYPELLETIKNS